MHPDLCVFPLKSIKNEVSLHQYMLETQALANMIIPGEKTHLKKKSHQKKKKKELLRGTYHNEGTLCTTNKCPLERTSTDKKLQLAEEEGPGMSELKGKATII